MKIDRRVRKLADWNSVTFKSEAFTNLFTTLARELSESPGELQRLTPSIEALYVPNIDEALDEEDRKREFWSAFRVLGQWWADLPPY